MKRKTFWTKSQARLQLLRQNNLKKYNWLFLPGGPGLGSESLNQLVDILTLPGNIWYLDLPGDGSNKTVHDELSFSYWSQSLVEATTVLDNIILAAHSAGGMFTLATPELENKLIGLILMNTSPNANWQESFGQYIKENPVEEAEKLQKNYAENPSNDLLQQLTLACAPYFSTPKSAHHIMQMLASLPFNYKTHIWAANNFHPTYQAKWIPQKIPTLIFSGEYDHITPLSLFLKLTSFQRPNIWIREITKGSHFPWFDAPKQVKQVFIEYYHWLDSLLSC